MNLKSSTNCWILSDGLSASLAHLFRHQWYELGWLPSREEVENSLRGWSCKPFVWCFRAWCGSATVCSSGWAFGLLTWWFYSPSYRTRGAIVDLDPAWGCQGTNGGLWWVPRRTRSSKAVLAKELFYSPGASSKSYARSAPLQWENLPTPRD